MTVENQEIQSTGSETQVLENTPVSTEVKEETGEPQVTGAEGTQTEAGAPAVAAEYKVNPEFLSFNEKKTFDEWAIPLIKDAETEKRFRDLFAAHHSLPRVKAKRDEYKTTLDKLQPEYTELRGTVERAVGYLKNQDMASFQREVGIPDELILLRAKQIFDQQANPALRQQEELTYNQNQKLFELETQNARYQEALQQQAIQQREFELQNRLAQPDVAQIVETFDQRVGYPGAFRNEVVRRGRAYYAEGEDRSVDSLVSELISLTGVSTNTVNQNPTQHTLPPNQTLATAPVKKPTIPQVSGRGTSPAKKIPKSIEDLRKMAEAAQARG